MTARVHHGLTGFSWAGEEAARRSMEGERLAAAGPPRINAVCYAGSSDPSRELEVGPRSGGRVVWIPSRRGKTLGRRAV